MQPRTFLRSTSHYSLGSLLTTLAGLISFPFLTRIFSVADYGVMNILSVTLLALVAIGKLGVQNAVLRFHGRTESQEGRLAPSVFFSTTVLGMAASALVVGAMWLALVAVIPFEFFGDRRLAGLFMLITALVVVQVIDSAFLALMRADQRTVLINTYQVLKKYLSLALMIGSLLVIRRDLVVFYCAQITAEVVAVVILAMVVVRAGGGLSRFAPRDFSVPLIREMLRYGVPLMLGWELSAIVLALGDRYLIQGLLGAAALGAYAAGYNLCQQVEAVLVTPWALAITPIYLSLWVTRGQDATSAFVAQSLRYYVLVGMPVVAGVAAIGSDLLVLLASDKYEQGASVIPLVMAGLVIGGAAPIAGAGVFVAQRTWQAAACMALSGALNLMLNVVLIPRMGIEGAALATVVSYVFLLVSMGGAGSRHLKIPPPWRVCVRAGIAALVMYAAISHVYLTSRLATVVGRVACGITGYAVLVLVLEPTAREGVGALLARARSLTARGPRPPDPPVSLT